MSSTFQIWAACGVSLIRCDQKCHVHFSPLTAVLELMLIYQTAYSAVIFSHKFLDSDCVNFKTFAFLAVHLFILNMHHTTQASEFNNF